MESLPSGINKIPDDQHPEQMALFPESFQGSRRLTKGISPRVPPGETGLKSGCVKTHETWKQITET